MDREKLLEKDDYQETNEYENEIFKLIDHSSFIFYFPKKVIIF
jgi:hypothetical protein